MVEPKLCSYEDFPESAASCEGMESMKLDPVKSVFINDGLIYRHADGTDLRMYIIDPAPAMPGMPHEPLPCVIYVNGSAWFQQMLLQNAAQLAVFAKRGYIIAMPEYRHSGIASFPAQAIDAKEAIRYVKKHSAELGVDPGRVVIWGDSSGGHTSLMAGITGEDIFPGDADPETDCRVRCIVDFFGPTQVDLMSDEHSIMDHATAESPEGRFLGNVNVLENRDLAIKAAPQTYVTKDREIPPILIVHGTKDRLVPFAQSVHLANRLREEEKEFRFIRLEGADHGSGEFWCPEMYDIVDGFIRKYI